MAPACRLPEYVVGASPHRPTDPNTDGPSPPIDSRSKYRSTQCDVSFIIFLQWYPRAQQVRRPPGSNPP